MRSLESRGAGEVVDGSSKVGPVRLGDHPALLADEKHGAVPLARPAARDVCVAARDAVDEPKGLEERERPVDLRRGRPPVLPVEPFEDLVGPDRPVFGEQKLENRTPVLGETLVPVAAGRLRPGESLGDAPGVIVPGSGER